MTVFATIAGEGVSRPDVFDVAPVATALSGIYGTAAASLALDGCILLTCGLRESDPPALITDRASGVAAVGQVLLEDAGAIRRRLGAGDSTPDLELILRAYLRWGARCTERLNGEFSWALWDGRDRLLLAARDGLGLRPLFAAERPGVMLVSNALRAAAVPGLASALDLGWLVTFLARGAPAAGRTPYHGVHPVPAGHTLRWSPDGQKRLARHWWFPQTDRCPPQTDRQIEEAYRNTLQCAVADRVRGRAASILLSGGVDSTTIAAAARAASPAADFHAFTAVYSRIPQGLDLPLARATADALRIPLTSVTADAHEPLDALTRGPDTPAPLDEPALTDWRALVGAAARHSPVVLYGEDGDALFHAPSWGELRRAMPLHGIAGAVCRYIAAIRRPPYLGIRLRERLGVHEPGCDDPIPGWLSPNARALLDGSGDAGWAAERAEPLPPHPTRSGAQTRLAAGVSDYLSTLLSPEVTGQRAELRLPLLDTRVIRLVVQVPPIPWCQAKRLPRRAFRGLLPPAVLERPKTGVPGMYEALVTSWRRSADRAAPRLEPPLDSWILREAWQEALDDRDPFVVCRAWRVLQVSAWLQRRCPGGIACIP